MSRITLNIPVLVRTLEEGAQSVYEVRPLFLPRPTVSERRYESALGSFKKAIKELFKTEEMNWGVAEQALWYAYQPDYNYRQIRHQFKLGGELIDAKFSVVSFLLQEKTFIYLPSINDFMFIGQPDADTGIVDIITESKRVILKLLRKERQQNIKEFNAEIFYAPHKELVSEVTVNFTLADGKFKFQKQNNNFFFGVKMPQQHFNGALEVHKVGYVLNDRYPAELRRSYFTEDKVNLLTQVLYQNENTPIVLVGKEGVGKHTLLEEVIYQYEESQRGRNDFRAQLYNIDPTRVIAGMSYVGQWQRRFEAILNFLNTPYDEKPAIQHQLLIDNAVALVRIGKTGQNSMTLADVLKPYLEKRKLQLVVLATPSEWKVVQDADRRFSDLFQVLRLAEPKEEQAIAMVLEKRRELEKKQGVNIQVKAISQLFTIHRNYLNNKALPGTVMKLLNQLAIKYRLQEVDVDQVREEFEDFSGLREDIFEPSVIFEPDQVRNEIRKGLIGQENAVEELADIVHLIKAKLTDPSRPSGSFLFAGPTGVGKTQAVKVLCKYLTGSEDNLLRFSMNEYQSPLDIHRLIGDEANPEGQLTGQVRYNPFGIILLDEIEKAHKSIYDLLLQVLDDGRLTVTRGRTVDFSYNIIIMTSDLGARDVIAAVSFGQRTTDREAIYNKAIRNHFRPEFINRIDKIVTFRELQLDEILRIAQFQIRELLKRDGFVRRTTILNVTKEALEWVATRGYDPKMGGRALKRQIEKDLTLLTANQLISTNFDQPIILNIMLKAERLFPQVMPLEFVQSLPSDWQPQIPEARDGYRFYSQLLREINRLERQIERHEKRQKREEQLVVAEQISGENLDWQHYDFKEKVASLRQHIETLRLGFQNNYFREAPAIPLRLKGGISILRREASRAGREQVKDIWFQKEALREINAAYSYDKAQFDSLGTEFLNNYLNVKVLEIYAEGFLSGRMDKIRLKFTSLVNQQGADQIAYLTQLYANFFHHANIRYTVDKVKNEMSVEGHSLRKLLAGEVGLHLFYLAYENPIPVRLELLNIDESSDLWRSAQVVRIYNQAQTLTDLRTGLTNDVNITERELTLLLWAGATR
ncbi:MAG: AAA family ATPase [Saprospiraceae bacterium]